MKTSCHAALRRILANAHWATIAGLLPTLWACNARTLARPENNPTRVGTVTFQQTINRQIDILFMVDNSQSMMPLQTKLLANFPVLMDQLKNLPMGLPDVHIAVASSDTGPGKFDLPLYNCRFRGDGGQFQSQPRGAVCATAALNPGQTFLQASNNQAIKNYTGDISDAFTCIAALGDGGCGFEGQLKSVRWALDPHVVPDGNQGFLRPQAYLGVILITNEDDCSLPDDSDLVDPTQTTMSDPLGPFWSFRCNEFGHLCNINGTLQPPPRGPAANLSGCVSNETSTGRLTRVGDEIGFLRSLKTDPDNQILVAAITGPATPYTVELVPGSLTSDRTDAQIASIKHSCVESTGEYADPSVRILQWVMGFGANGLLLPICADSFERALFTIGQKLTMLLKPQCIQGTLRDADPSTAALDPECQVTDHYINDQNVAVETPLPACAGNGNSPPCWSIVDDAMNCAGAKTLAVNRGTLMPPSGLSTNVSCVLCIPGVTQSGCP
jgi:hypothetical protein